MSLYLIQLLKLECTIPGVKPNVNYGLWVIMLSQCRSTSSNKCTTLVQDVDNWGDCECVGSGDCMRTLYFPLNFAMNLKLC